MTHKQRSLHTRQAFAAALKQRMLHQPFPQITVSDLIRDCSVNRKTFYYHFTDLYDLLNWTLQQDTLTVLSQFNLIQEHEQAISFVLDYIEQNQVILSNIYHSIGRDVLKRCFYDEVTSIARQLIDEAEQLQQQTVPDSFKHFLCEFCTEAISGVLFSSLSDPSLRDRQHITEYLTTTLRATITGSLRAIANS